MDLVHSELTCVFYFILNKSTKYSNFFLLFLSIFFLIFSFPQNFYTRKLDGIKVFFAVLYIKSDNIGTNFNAQTNH